jgi:hypothetical protein
MTFRGQKFPIAAKYTYFYYLGAGGLSTFYEIVTTAYRYCEDWHTIAFIFRETYFCGIIESYVV